MPLSAAGGWVLLTVPVGGAWAWAGAEAAAVPAGCAAALCYGMLCGAVVLRCAVPCCGVLCGGWAGAHLVVVVAGG